ncbi:MAG: type II secretion system protein [Bacillota bacterium]
MERGFSLLELLVTLSVLAVVTSAVIATYTGLFAGAGEVALMSNLQRIQRAVDLFYLRSGYYPTGFGSEIGPQPGDWAPEERPFGLLLVMTAEDPDGNSFVGHYLRSPPARDGAAYGLPVAAGDVQLHFGVTMTGQVFATAEDPHQ